MLKFAVFCSLLIVSAYASQNQIFVWSNGHVAGNNVQNLDTIYSSDVASLLQAAVHGEQNEFSQYFTNQHPDLTYVFLADSKLTQFPSLQNILNSVSGSLALPYGYFTQSIESTIAEFASQSDNVFIVGHFSVEGANSISVEKAMELERGLVVADFRGLVEADVLVSEFSEKIAERNAMAVLMDISVDSDVVEFTNAKRGYRAMKQVLDYGETAPYDTRFPAYIIEGLLVSFMLIFIAVVGIVCSCQIQAPEGFETPHKHKD